MEHLSEHDKTFKSSIGVFIFYNALKAITFSAFIYYFLGLIYCILALIIMLLMIFTNAYIHNHVFILSNEYILIKDIFNLRKVKKFNYASIEELTVKYPQEYDNRQWVEIFADNKKLRFRCDWIHLRDEGEDDHDDTLEHELFELIKDEDFYEGSLNQLEDLIKVRLKNIG